MVSVEQVALGVTVLASSLMAFCFFMVLELRKQFKKTVISKQWSQLSAMIGLFLLAYVFLAFFPTLPEEVMFLAVALVFLFGAVYVLMTIHLIRKIVDSCKNADI